MVRVFRMLICSKCFKKWMKREIKNNSVWELHKGDNLLAITTQVMIWIGRKYMLGKVHKVNHFYVFIVANPVAMLDMVLTIPRGDKTISLMEVAHSTAEINGQLLVKRKMMFHTAKPQIQPVYISNWWTNHAPRGWWFVQIGWRWTFV